MNNALKGHNKRVVENLVAPFQGWENSHSDRIPRASPWAFLFRPLRGGDRKAQLQKAPAKVFLAYRSHAVNLGSLRRWRFRLRRKRHSPCWGDPCPTTPITAVLT